MMDTAQRREVVLVTGLSGAGKASILNVLEDLGFETVDNPPLSVLEALVGDGIQALAAGVDCRTRDFDAATAMRLLDRLRMRPDINVTLVFATAEPDVLLRRFTETRRRHPLAPGGPLGNRVADGIAREAALMAPLTDSADLIVDTTDLPLPDMRRLIERRFRQDAGPGLAVTVMSFAYPKGLPREADLVFDLRFLSNPHYDPALRPLTGRDAAVAAFIEADPDFPRFWSNLIALLAPLLPRYVLEGKKYLTIAFGCTGGKHRSVLAAERLAHHLQQDLKHGGWRVDLIHREIGGGSAPPSSLGAAAYPGREALFQTS
ncbi:MAG: RNase adapter RapZ [Rhodospirillales bacterium]|jgi:UPF0042 nucleotide-binding protein|nr:RNase adapter RapZ [Rhodospirillales bacterium]